MRCSQQDVVRIRVDCYDPRHELNVDDAFASQNTKAINFPKVDKLSFWLSEELSVSVPIQLGLF